MGLWCLILVFVVCFFDLLAFRVFFNLVESLEAKGIKGLSSQTLFTLGLQTRSKKVVLCSLKEVKYLRRYLQP